MVQGTILYASRVTATRALCLLSVLGTPLPIEIIPVILIAPLLGGVGGKK